MLKQLKKQINLTAFKRLTKLLWTSFCLSTGIKTGTVYPGKYINKAD